MAYRTDQAQPGPERPRVSPGTVLVVDPAPTSLLTLAGVFHSQGYRCTCGRDVAAAEQAIAETPYDVFVWDLGDEAAAAEQGLVRIRAAARGPLPAVLIAEPKWAGLEKRAERFAVTTRCLFKPIDPQALIAVVQQLLWMPTLVSAHRRRGTLPNRPGWVGL